MEALDLLSSDDEDQRLPEDDLHRVAEEQHDMAEEQHLTAEVKRRNWVEDTVSWKTHGNPNADTWELPGVQQRRAAVRRFPMVVAWFGPIALGIGASLWCARDDECHR